MNEPGVGRNRLGRRGAWHHSRATVHMDHNPFCNSRNYCRAGR